MLALGEEAWKAWDVATGRARTTPMPQEADEGEISEEAEEGDSEADAAAAVVETKAGVVAAGTTTREEGTITTTVVGKEGGATTVATRAPVTKMHTAAWAELHTKQGQLLEVSTEANKQQTLAVAWSACLGWEAVFRSCTYFVWLEISTCHPCDLVI
jgi:hypothetical protein